MFANMPRSSTKTGYKICAQTKIEYKKTAKGKPCAVCTKVSPIHQDMAQMKQKWY